MSAAAGALVVVGGGHAGGCAVAAMREAGFSGSITLVGSEQRLPYERPPLSKAVLTRPRAEQDVYLRDPSFYTRHDITTLLGRTAELIDRKAARVHLDDGTSLPYDRLLIATGASPRIPRIPIEPSARVLVLRSLDDALALRACLQQGIRLAIVGGGTIGLEVAASATTLGCSVVIVEAADRVMARCAPLVLSRYLERLHRSHGVELITDARLVAISTEGAVARLTLADGRALAADLVLLAVGVSPNTALARAADLAVDDGIIVDAYGCSSDPAISCAGDAAKGYSPLVHRHLRQETWLNAQSQAIAAASTMIGRPTANDRCPWYWSDQYDAVLQVAGMTEADAEVVVGDTAVGPFVAFYCRDDQVVGAVGVNARRPIRAVVKALESGVPLSVEAARRIEIFGTRAAAIP